MNVSTLDSQIDILKYHFKKFEETNLLYHLIAIGDLIRFIKETYKLTDDDLIDLRTDLVAYYDSYKEMDLAEQLTTCLSYFKRTDRKLEIADKVTKGITDYIEHSKAENNIGINKQTRVVNTRIKRKSV